MGGFVKHQKSTSHHQQDVRVQITREGVRGGLMNFSVSFSLGGVTFPNTVYSRFVFAMNMRVALIPFHLLRRYLMLY